MQDETTSAGGRGVRRRWPPYAVAAILTLASQLLRLSLDDWVGDQPILIIYVLPVIVAAYLGGLWPGLFATMLASLVAVYYGLPPRHSFGFASPVDFAQWLFLVIAGVLVSVLFAELAGWRRRTSRDVLDRKQAATERKVRLGFAVAIAFLGAIGVVSYLSVVRLKDTSALVTHSHAVMSNIDALVATTFESESAQRAYVLSGEEPFAADYTEAIGRVGGLLQELRDGVRDNAAQTQRVGALARAVDARLKQSDEIMELRRSSGMQAVQQRLARTRSRPGASLQEQVRAIAQEMKSAEFVQLNERELRAHDSARVTQLVIVGGSALAVVFVGVALFAIRRDFAGRARAETELNRFFDVSLDLYVISSGDGYFKRVSRAITELLGYSVEEALRTPYMELIHPDDRIAAKGAVDKQLLRGEHVDQFVNRLRHKDGSWRTLSWRSIPRGDLMFASARDVTDSVNAEQELREAKEKLELRVAERTSELEESNRALSRSERRFRALIEHGSDSIVLIDSSARVIYVSPAVKNVEGYEPEEIIGLQGREGAHPADLPVLRRTLEHVMAHPGKPTPMIWRRRHKAGHWIWLEGVATNLLDDPSVGAIVTNYRDITERIAHETRLAEQLQRLALLSRITRATAERQDLRSVLEVVARALEDELPVDFCGFCLYDIGQNLLTVSCIGDSSGPMAHSIGLRPNSIVPVDENGLGRCVGGQLVYEPDIGTSTFDFPRRLAGTGMRSLVIAPLLVESHVFGVLMCARRAPDAFVSGECEFLRQVSEHTALAANQAQLNGALQRAYDDLRQTQQQVMQHERLRALGQMASGIAHDINNAISPMSLYTEALLEREPNLTERGRKQLETIQRAVDDVAQTVARMGEFYRLREPRSALRPVDLNLLVEHVVDLTRARWSDMAQQRGAVIELKLDLDPALPKIAAVESQIRDALVNLVFNAVDAMPNGGPLAIRTHTIDDAKRSVAIEVIDSGIGMDEETRRRCLEPFFTTKGERGTGLGLAMVYGVAERHGASLEVESQPGRGTTVRLSFATNAALGEPGASQVDAPVSQVVPHRILIVDDDPMLLKSLRDALEADGHEVVVANGGQAGINAFVESHAEGRPFPVVITDLGMPHVDGRKVASTIKASVPETKVLLLTGWGRRLASEGDIPPGVDGILSKPPRLVELRAALSGAGEGISGKLGR